MLFPQNSPKQMLRCPEIFHRWKTALQTLKDHLLQETEKPWENCGFLISEICASHTRSHQHKAFQLKQLECMNSLSKLMFKLVLKVMSGTLMIPFLL